MPKLWQETIEAHRREVHDAILETTASLVATHGLLSVTMSQVAEETGIGRATLYKYFRDVEAILLAWHERHVTRHLERLAELQEQTSDAGERLQAVFEAYALIHHELAARHRGGLPTPGTEIAAFLHRGEHVAHAQQRVRDLITEVLSEAAAAGVVRDDVTLDELASFSLHALATGSDLPSKAAVRRLVDVTLSGLRAPAGHGAH